MYLRLNSTFRAFIHANIAFNTVENPYFQAFLNGLRPMYDIPSRYVLQHTTLDAEAARVEVEELEALSKHKSMTLLVDGWEDIAGRSLYGVVASEVGEPPIVLGLSDLTGKRGTANAVVDVCVENIERMDIPPRHFAGLCTDNPTVMISTRSKFEIRFPWIIVSCFAMLNK